MSNSNEIPVQLDLEGGFVVGQQKQSNSSQHQAVKEEYDEYYEAKVKEEYYESSPVKGEYYDHDAKNNHCAIKDEYLDDFNYGFDKDCEGDAYCEEEGYRGLHSDEDQEQSTEKEQSTSTMKQSSKESCKKPTSKDSAPKFIQGPPPSLLSLSLQVVSSNLEKYYPQSFAIFSECEWESVVACRCETFTSVSASLHSNSKKLLMPPISEKILSLIEEHPDNSHLNSSNKVDRMLWKNIVNYAFPIGGMTRPVVLEEPYDDLVERLTLWGKDLVELFELENPTKDGGNQVEARSDDSDDDTVNKEGKPAAQVVSEKDRLKRQSVLRTKTLYSMLQTIKSAPMDVKLISDTGIGKCLSKVTKKATKLLKHVQEQELDKEEMRDALVGYPFFWEENCRLRRYGSNNLYTELRMIHPSLANDGECKNLTPLKLLQQLLNELKDLASEAGVTMSSSASSSKKMPPNKKQRVDTVKASSEDESYPFATFGNPRNTKTDEHLSNMKLLRSSPNWKALYRMLRKREETVRITQGEKVRATRENLEKNRRKTGKVVLKKAVARVQGLESPAIGSSGSQIASSLKGHDRREAILNKSLGKRAQERQSNVFSSSNSPSRSSSKLSQLRQESKVQAKWSKGTQQTVSKITHNSNITFSAFGASVAQAGCQNNRALKLKPQMVGDQARVNLQGGKRLTLPAAASARSVGMFSSLQKEKSGKKSVGERLVQNGGKRKR